MTLNINKYFILLLLLFWGLAKHSKANILPDSLKAPRLHNITYYSENITRLEKYYKKYFYDDSNIKKRVLAFIYTAELFRYKKNIDSSFYYLSQANRLIEKHKINDRLIRFQYYKTLASSQYFRDFSRGMLESIDSALTIKRTIEFDSIEIADLHYLKYLDYENKGIYDSAIRYLNLSQIIYPKKIQVVERYSSLQDIANLYRIIGEYGKAEELLFQALKDSEDNKPYQKSYTFYSLGRYYYSISDYEKSKYYYKLKLEHDSIFNLSDALKKGKILKEIGIVYFYEEDYLSSITYFKRAIKSLPIQPSNDLVISYYLLGQAYERIGQYNIANKYFTKSIKTAKVGGRKVESHIYASSYIKLGRFETMRLMKNIGICRIDSGLKILETRHSFGHKYFNSPYIHLSDAYKVLKKNYSKSMYYLQLALRNNLTKSINSFCTEINPNNSKNLINLMSILSRKIILLNRWIENSNSQQQVDSLSEALFNTINSYERTEEFMRMRIKSNESRLTRTSSYKKHLSYVFNGLRKLHNNVSDYKYAYTAYKLSSKNKAMTLQESLNEVNIKSELIPDSLVQLGIKYSNRIAALNDLIYREKEKSKPNTNRIKLWNKQLQKENESKDYFTHQMENQFPEYYRLKHEKQYVTVKDVQRSLYEGQVLIEYNVLYDNSIMIFAITKNDFRYIPLIVDQDIFKKLEKLLSIINLSSFQDFNSLQLNEFKASAHYLYQTLIEPVADMIEGKELIINPDDRLWYLPFEILLSDSAEQVKNYRDLPYLLKKHPISYAYSTKLYFDKDEDRKANPNDILTIVPSYDASINYADELLENNSNRTQFNPLLSSITEAEHIHKTLGGTLLKGDEASEKAFKEIADQYKILHLAMHAVIDNKNPQYSKLIFTHSVDTTEDNYLNTYEIYNKQLNADLAVLSSCNSGSGKMQKGEGIISIARAFLYAGCPSLITTLWSVDDASSAKLMQYFYDNLKAGMKKSAALQQAKLKFLETASPIQQHPYFWASYTQIGNDEPIQLNNSSKTYYIIGGILLLIILFSGKILKLLKKVKN